MRDKVRKRVRAKHIRQEGFGRHISDKQLIQFHEQLAKDRAEEKRKKRMD